MKCFAMLLIFAVVCVFCEAAAIQNGQTLRHRLTAKKVVAMRRSSADAGTLIADDPVQNEVVPLSEVENHEAETPLISEVPTVEANAEKNDNSENDDDLDDNGESVFVPTTFGKQPHTFFPIHFGRTTGGTIAVANSYNTGKGAALSHSEAHGTKRNH